jgi:hypothetical protein
MFTPQAKMNLDAQRSSSGALRGFLAQRPLQRMVGAIFRREF